MTDFLHPEVVVRVVAAHFGVTVEDLTMGGNQVPLPTFRHIAAHACHRLTLFSWPEIGDEFGWAASTKAPRLNRVETSLLERFLNQHAQTFGAIESGQKYCEPGSGCTPSRLSASPHPHYRKEPASHE